MVPIGENQRVALITMLQREYTSLADDLKEFKAIGDKERNETIDKEQADIEAAMEVTRDMIDNITTGRWVVFDNKPACYAITKDERCTETGRYSPIMAFTSPQGQPLGQVERQPRILLCEKHCIDELDAYFPDESWREIQAQVSQQAGIVVQRQHCQLLFMDMETGTVIPPNKKVVMPKSH